MPRRRLRRDAGASSCRASTCLPRRPRLPVAEARRERYEGVHVGEVGGQAERCANSACGLAVDGVHELLVGHPVGVSEADRELLLGESEGDLTCARVAVAPGPQRVARECDKTVIMVKRYQGPVRSWLKRSLLLPNSSSNYEPTP